MGSLDIALRELEKTCDICPSQWEGKTVDGQIIYVRYRHSVLMVGIGDDLQEAVRRAMFDPLLRMNWDDGASGGVMDTNTMLRLTGMSITEVPPDAE